MRLMDWESISKLLFNSRSTIAFLLRILNLIFQFASLYFVLEFLSPVQLGLYYLFLSFFSLQVLCDMGFTKTMSIFISHESKTIKFSSNCLQGDTEALRKIKGILVLVLNWFKKSIIALFLLYLLLGVIFFKIKEDNQNIFIFWIQLSFFSCISVISSLLIAFLQGINQINKANVFAAIQLIFSNIFFFLLLEPLALKALMIKVIISIAILLIYLIFNKQIIFQFFKIKKLITYEVNAKFLKQQKRFAITALLGYFILNSFIPFTYYFISSEVSGQLGLTFQITATVSAFMMVIFNINFPLISQKIALNEIRQARQEFYSILKIVMFLFILSYLIFLGLLNIDFFSSKINGKILSNLNFVLIILGSLGFLYVELISSFLRLFKKEFFVKHALYSLILSFIFLFFLGLKFKTNGVVISYLLLSLFGIFNVIRIHNKFFSNEKI